MPKKKVVPQEEPEQAIDSLSEEIEPGGGTFEQPGAQPQEDHPQEGGLPDGMQLGEKREAENFPSLPEEAPEVVEVVVSEPLDPASGEEPPTEPQEPVPIGDAPMEDRPAAAEAEQVPPPASLPGSDAPTAPIPPMTDRQSFFALDFREVDRGLTAEERQAWSSIYASFRGRSALSGRIIGADPHSMNVRNRETGKVERRTMYCVVVLLYRVPIYIPATEMWTGEARPDYVLQNMMGTTIDFIITKVDREGGYAIASRRQAARAQRYFFAHRPDLCRTGSRVKCRVLAVGPRRCLVECYGHDVDLTQRELRYTAIADLRTEYHPGDELDCIVKGYNAGQRELQISVKETESNPFEGAELRHPVGSRRFAVIAGKYGGGVFCNLPDGTVCMCNYSYQHEDSDFQAGDSVMLVVQRFEREKRQMYGKILSKW